ncbi:UNKNOWN [Stylonychia lemnae]|uniref:Leucine Rich Repeat family protein n=1 Tax=Stylonychia lemnae TaxID=5949 RepID=A0A077ZRP1_STYLE|nr:UNKNOWN [Stylonychia lemnae]|eukprot:CDW72588.1 UNKNOWN [Stylonychia lemnae]
MIMSSLKQSKAPQMLESYDGKDPRFTMIDYNRFKHNGNNQANLNIKKALGDISKKRKEINDINTSRSHIQNIIAQNKLFTNDSTKQSDVYDENHTEKVPPVLIIGKFSLVLKSYDQAVQQEQFFTKKLRTKPDFGQFPQIQNHKNQAHSLRNSIDHKQFKQLSQFDQSFTNTPGYFRKEVDQVMNDESLLKGYKDVSTHNNKISKERFTIFQQDFEVRINKMNNHLDSELNSLSKNVQTIPNNKSIGEFTSPMKHPERNLLSPKRHAQHHTKEILIKLENQARDQHSNQKSHRYTENNSSAQVFDKINNNTGKFLNLSPRLMNDGFANKDMAEITFGNNSKATISFGNFNSTTYSRESSFDTEAEFVKDGIDEDFTSEELKLQEQEFSLKIEQMINEFQIKKELHIHHNSSSNPEYSRRSISPQFEILSKNLKEQTIEQLVHDVKEKNNFNEVCKQYSFPSQSEKLDLDPNLQYFLKCYKENVLALPTLSRIQNKQFSLQGYPLNKGICKAVKKYLQTCKNCLTKLALDNNALQDKWLKSILQGVESQDDFKQIILCRNHVGKYSTAVLSNILKRTFPKNLEDLRITNCKITSTCSANILISIKESLYLKRLSLVKANLSDYCIGLLSQVLTSSRHLIDLDISWNGLRSQNLREFWTALSKFIKYNKNLLHLDLSHTRLESETVREIGTNLRKAKSLLSIHFTGNPGANQEVRQFLFERIHAKTNQNYNHMIEMHVSQQHRPQSPRSSQVIDGVQMKILTRKRKMIDSVNLQNLNPPADNLKLIFQRFLGHKFEQPGSGQWQMLTQDDIYDAPVCCECWICSKWIYTIIFWSKSIEYAVCEEQISNDQQSLEALSRFDDKKISCPQIAGGFNSWTPQEFIKLSDYCYHLDPAKNDAIKIMKKQGKIREEVASVSQLNQKDQITYQQIQNEVNQDYRQHWKDIVTKQNKYKKIQYINNIHLENVDLRNEEVFIYACFMRPGKNSYLIKSHETQEVNMLRSISCLREEDIPICKINYLITPFKDIKGTKQKTFQRVFKKDTSVFKEWKEDTPQTIQLMLDDDLKYWKIHRFIKDDNDRLMCEKIIRQNVVLIKKIFITEICNSSFPNISWIDFSNFCEKCKIFDKNVIIATIDRIFIATNVELEKNDDNPDKALQRYEFYEILVRIAQAKFRDPGITPTINEGLTKLLNEHIFPLAEPDSWQEFRDEQLWVMEVNDILEANLEGLKKVYSYYWEPRKKFMTYQDTINLMLRDSQLNLIEKDAVYCYGMCKMSVITESNDTWQYKQLKFVELLELIGRIAILKFKNSENETLALYKKIEYILDILLKMVEVQRKDVNIQVNEESESDDEY